MRSAVLATTLLVLLAGITRAQERIPADEADKAARVLAEQSAKLDNPQVKVEPDTDKPFGIQARGRAALVLPDKKLTEATIARAGKDPMPVGQLWLRNLAPAVGGKSVPNDQLRILKIMAGADEHMLPLCLLAVRQGAKGEPELLVYGKEKEPLATLPLRKVDSKQENPIELEGKGEGETGTLTIILLGKYEAVLPVGKQE